MMIKEGILQRMVISPTSTGYGWWRLLVNIAVIYNAI